LQHATDKIFIKTLKNNQTNLIKYFEKAAFIFCAVIIALFVVSEAVEIV